MSSRLIADDLEKQLNQRVISVEPIPAGHSGFTYFVETEASRRYVLRLPPPGARIAATADVVRQGRIMSSLHAAGLPTPAIPYMSADAVVDGRPFVLMEAVDGLRIEVTSEREKPEEIAASAVGVLKRIHALPVEQSGIGDEEPMPLVAEMMRWAMLMQRAPEELTTRAGELGGMLAAGAPAEHTPTLVHGDYHYGNMLFRGPQVVAVLDWEIAQIGQPLMDLGCLAIMSHRSQFKDAQSPGGSVALPDAGLFALYGVDAGEMNWYVAMSLYKYAAILGYNLMLHRRGKRPDPFYETLTTTITGMIDEGVTLLS